MRPVARLPKTASQRRQTSVWLAGLALAVAWPAAAETPAEETSSSQPSIGAEAAAPAGLRAFIDPETGELTSTPTREQIDGLSKAMADVAGPLSRSSLGLEPFDLANGGRGVHLKKRFQSALVVQVVDGGELELVCRDDGSEAEHEHPVAAAAPTEWAEK